MDNYTTLLWHGNLGSFLVCATGVIKDPREVAVFLHRTCFVHAFTFSRMLDATQLHILYMFHATQLHIHVSCYATACARTVRIMHGWGGGVGVVACVVLAHMRCVGTQALDKVWSHVKRRVPKSPCSRSKFDRRFNPRMEQ